ncbi:MAG: hypothetical protein WCQ89_10250 [Verrucomicrobiota bacterium]|jgi:hypothetical protein
MKLPAFRPAAIRAWLSLARRSPPALASELTYGGDFTVQAGEIHAAILFDGRLSQGWMRIVVGAPRPGFILLRRFSCAAPANGEPARLNR